MGNKTDKLRRVVKKLSDRYGAEDESVQHLQSELAVLETLETRPLERRSFKTQDIKFQTPAKQIFFASSEDVRH